MKKRLIIFWDYYGPYHIARLLGAVRAGKAEGYEVHGLELAGQSATYAWKREPKPAGVPFHTLFPHETAEKIGVLRVYQACAAYFDDSVENYLFVPSYWPAYALAAALAAKRRGARVMLMAESHYATGRNDGSLVWIKRALMRLYSSTLVGGSAQRSFFRYLGVPDSHIFDGYDVVENSYFEQRADSARAQEADWRERLELPRRYILSLGRFVPKKNLQILIKAYAGARAQGGLRGVHLMFVGSGVEQASLIETARRLGLPVFIGGNSGKAGGPGGCPADHAVHFRPFAQIEETPVYFGLAECFVLASQVEEWGLVVNEAMCCGCPVVVSRAVGCSYDLISNTETGFCFDPNNTDELTRCLSTICADVVLRDDMIAKAKTRIASWGPDRFGRNAVLAAKAACSPYIDTAEDAETARSIVLLQTSFPDYRIPVYSGLSKRIGERFQLHTGMDYFTPDVKTCSEFKPWIYIVKNNFFWGRKLLWQSGVFTALLDADVVILELNPRILSNWLILFVRRLWGRPTVAWGHAWGRQGEGSGRNVFRLMMAKFANAVITYTHSQAEQLRRVLPHAIIKAAPNSLVERRECSAVRLPVGELNMILYVGRLNPAKKPALLLNAFARALPSLPSKICLCFVGSGPEERSLTQQVVDMGLVDRVQLRGHIMDRNVLRSLYEQSLCSVSPGYVGLSCIQSFSFGVPMVIADQEDHAPEIEACEDGVNCRFFRSDDAGDLARVLVEMHESRDEWYVRAPSIVGGVSSRYSTDSMVESFSEIINKLDQKS